MFYFLIFRQLLLMRFLYNCNDIEVVTNLYSFIKQKVIVLDKMYMYIFIYVTN